MLVKNDDTIRATTPESIAARVFAPGSDDTELALRGLMLARALPEANDSRARVAGATPAFRVHTFIRNIEGLFASVTPRQHSVTFSDFSVERGTSHSSPRNGSSARPPAFLSFYIVKHVGICLSVASEARVAVQLMLLSYCRRQRIWSTYLSAQEQNITMT